MINKNLKAEIVRKFGNQFLFSRFTGDHESVVSRVVRGKVKLSAEKEKEWAVILDIDDPKKIFEAKCQEKF